MSNTDPQKAPIQPTRRDRLKPLELLGFSAVLSLFAALIVLGTTRNITLTLVTFGLAFIICVMTVALIGLGGKPSAADEEARRDLQRPQGH